MSDHRILPWTDRIWWSTLDYPKDAAPPLTEGGAAVEPDYPWRKGMCRIFRMPRSSHAVAVGVWKGSHPWDIDEDGSRILRFRPIKWNDVLHDRKTNG